MTQYEIIIWVGCSQSTRSINWFDITRPKPHMEALRWFKAMVQVAQENNEDGFPYFSVYKWVNETRYEFGDGGPLYYDGGYTDLPKYVQKSINPLIEFQNTIDYINNRVCG